jgi:hypothetical protein
LKAVIDHNRSHPKSPLDGDKTCSGGERQRVGSAAQSDENERTVRNKVTVNKTCDRRTHLGDGGVQFPASPTLGIGHSVRLSNNLFDTRSHHDRIRRGN